MLRKIWLASALFLSATLAAHATTDLKGLEANGQLHIPDDGIVDVMALPGHTVLRVWGQMHLYFEKSGVNQNGYCDLFRKANPQFASLFTAQSGCTNPGFNKLPAGVIWHVPFPTIGYGNVKLGDDETFVAVHTDGYTGVVAMKKGPAFGYLTEQANNVAPSGKQARIVNNDDVVVSKADYAKMQTALKAQEAAAAAPAPQAAASPQRVITETEQKGGIINDPFLWLSVVLFVIGAIAIIALYRSKKEAQTAMMAARSNARHYKEEVNDLKKGMQRVAATFELPSNMRREHIRAIVVPILEWKGEVGKSDALVHVAGAKPQGIGLEYDTEKGALKAGKLFKHLNDTTSAAALSRLDVGIDLPPKADVHRFASARS